VNARFGRRPLLLDQACLHRTLRSAAVNGNETLVSACRIGASLLIVVCA